MSLVPRKLSLGFPTRFDTNQTVQPQKMATAQKLRIYEEEGLYYLCCENKGADQLRSSSAQLICAFIFAYAKSRFSHDSAHIVFSTLKKNGFYHFQF